VYRNIQNEPTNALEFLKVILLRLSEEETEILTKPTTSSFTNLDHNSSHVPFMYITYRTILHTTTF